MVAVVVPKSVGRIAQQELGWVVEEIANRNSRMSSLEEGGSLPQFASGLGHNRECQFVKFVEAGDTRLQCFVGV